MLPFDCLLDVVVVGFRSALNSSVSDFRKVVLFVKVCWDFFWGWWGIGGMLLAASLPWRRVRWFSCQAMAVINCFPIKVALIGLNHQRELDLTCLYGLRLPFYPCCTHRPREWGVRSWNTPPKCGLLDSSYLKGLFLDLSQSASQLMYRIEKLSFDWGSMGWAKTSCTKVNA